MKKINLIIIAVALVLGLGQCKKKDLPETPETPTSVVEGELFHISVDVNEGSKHIVYPESGAYVFENGDKLYVGNHGYYVGTLEYYNGAFDGDIYFDTASYNDYLHFYFIGGDYTGSLVQKTTTSFEWSIADQTGSKLPILSYGHSTDKFTTKKTAYSCMLENQCGLVKLRAWPAPSSTPTCDTVKISGMKTTALIDFANPGITSTADTGFVKLHKVDGSDPAERWAILLPQNSVSDAMFSYKKVDDNDTVQTIYMPAIRANTYYGGYNGLSVGLEYVDLGLSVLWAACNVGSCTHEGYGKFFAWAHTAPKSAYCWSKYKYAYNPKYYPECPGPGGDADTIHYEYGDNGPNLGLTKYNTKEEWDKLKLGFKDDEPDGKTTLDPGDDAALAIMGNGWRTPSVEEWNELIEGTTQERALVNGIGGIRYTAPNGNSIFLPFAGSYTGDMHSNYSNCGNQPQGQYWSNEIDADYPYRAYILYFDDPNYTGDVFTTYGMVASTITFYDPVEYARYQGRPVRAVHAKPMGY